MLKKLYAECFATFAMVFFGTGAIVLNDVTDGQVGLLGIAFAFGAVIAAMVWFLGPISGAHMNPAVTVSLAYAKRLPSGAVLPYICAQFVGAIFASLSFLYFSRITPRWGQLCRRDP